MSTASLDSVRTLFGLHVWSGSLLSTWKPCGGAEPQPAKLPIPPLATGPVFEGASSAVVGSAHSADSWRFAFFSLYFPSPLGLWEKHPKFALTALAFVLPLV